MMKKSLKWLFIISIIISCLLGFLFPNEHAHFFWQKIQVFDAIFAFVGVIVISLISKTLAKVLLHKEEDYYDD